MKKEKADRFFPRIFMLILACFFAMSGHLFAGGADTLAPALFLDKADLRSCFTAGVDEFAPQLEDENQRYAASILEKEGDISAIKNVMGLISGYHNPENSALGREQAQLMIGHFTKILEFLCFNIGRGRLEEIYLELLDDADPQIRRASILQLSAVAGNKSIKRAITLLKSEDAFLVRAALGILKEHRIKEALPRIVPLCGNSDEKTAEAAMEIIKDFNPGINVLSAVFASALKHRSPNVVTKAVRLFGQEMIEAGQTDLYELFNSPNSLIRSELAQVLIDEFDSFSRVRQRDIGINLLSVFKNYQYEYFPAVKKLYKSKFFSKQVYAYAIIYWVNKAARDYKKSEGVWRAVLEEKRLEMTGEFLRIQTKINNELLNYVKYTWVNAEGSLLREKWALAENSLKDDCFFNVGTLYDLLCLLEFKEHVEGKKENRIFIRLKAFTTPQHKSIEDLGKSAYDMLKSQELLITLRQQNEEQEWGYADLGKVVPFGAHLVFNVNTKRNYSITLQKESGEQIPLQIFFRDRTAVSDAPRLWFTERAI